MLMELKCSFDRVLVSQKSGDHVESGVPPGGNILNDCCLRNSAAFAGLYLKRLINLQHLAKTFSRPLSQSDTVINLCKLCAMYGMCSYGRILATIVILRALSVPILSPSPRHPTALQLRKIVGHMFLQSASVCLTVKANKCNFQSVSMWCAVTPR